MSVYFKHAAVNIQCECPLCFCPYSLTKFPRNKKKRYSFVYVNNRKKFIYLCIGKNASTTIRKSFFSGNKTSLIDPTNDLKNYFKFTFVRNPWDRMVSNWKMFTSEKHPNRINQIRSMTDKDVSKFEDFVSVALTIPNHHWLPQVNFLSMPVDFFGRVESMQKGIAYISKKVSVHANKRAKHNAIKGKPYPEYYTPTLADVVGEYYSEDVEKFGYTFEG